MNFDFNLSKVQDTAKKCGKKEAQIIFNELHGKQLIARSYDFVRTFTAVAGQSNYFNIPLPTEGAFLSFGYNISTTKNSTVTPNGGSPQNRSFVKLQFRAQNDNAAQSNDLIPIELISTPFGVDGVRYGIREFKHLYNDNDSLKIEYSNLAPSVINGETYNIQNEVVSICFTGILLINAHLTGK